ncbi:MAG: DUF6427 family protein [Moheibacter sp.]
MLANILSKKSFFVQIVLGTLFSFLFFGRLHSEGLLFQYLWGISAFLILVLLGSFFLSSSKLFKNPGLPFWFFIIWMFAFSGIATDFRFSCSMVFSTALIWRMVRAEEKSDSKNYAFDVGVCLSLTTVFFPPAVFLTGLILFNYLYMQSLNLRVILLFVLGFVFPLAVGLQFLYLSDQMHRVDEMSGYFRWDFWDFSPLLWLLPIGLLLLIVWMDHIAHSGTQDINKRHIYFLFFLYFLNWVIILLLFGGNQVDLLAVLGLPLSVFLGRYVQYQGSVIWKEIALWGFLAVMAGFYFRIEIMEIYRELLGNVAF